MALSRADSYGKRIKLLLYFYLLFLGYVVISNCSLLIVNTLLLFVLCAIILISPFEYIFLIIPILEIYFGYSFIEYKIIGFQAFGSPTFSGFIYLFLAVRSIIFIVKHKVKFDTLVLFFLFYISGITVITGRLFDAVKLFSVTLVIITMTNRNGVLRDYWFQVFLWLSIIVILSVFPYNYLHVDLQNYGWRAYQFSGVRDPNNFALHSNIFLFYYLFSYRKINKGFLCYLVIGVLIYGVLATMSLSGLVTLALIGLLYFSLNKKNIVKIIVIGLLICFLIAISVIYGNIPLPRVFTDRMPELLISIAEKDTNTITTGRFNLWIQYLGAYFREDLFTRLFGNGHAFSTVRTSLVGSSHNAYIDFLYKYGLAGTVLFLVVIIAEMTRKAKKKNVLFWLGALVLLNMAFRTMEGFFVLFPLLYSGDESQNNRE